MQKLTSWFNQRWYTKGLSSWPLAPLAWIYGLGQAIDARLKKYKQPLTCPIPVIVVGNLSLGGSGKTPLVLALITFLQNQGIQVGVVMRGYKSTKLNYPYQVLATDDAHKIGDEAALIAQKTQVPIVLDPKRQNAVNTLAQIKNCQVIISDDGLQHHAMARTLEIVVIDGQRGFGNGHLFPRGPLRESIKRLDSVQLIVINGKPNRKLQTQLANYQNKTYLMELQANACYGLDPQYQIRQPLAAFAGIGNPERFFQTLKKQGFYFKPYTFPDHYRYQAKDFDIPESSIIMTEKDAIKCQHLTQKPILVLPVKAELSPDFWQRLKHEIGLNENRQ